MASDQITADMVEAIEFPQLATRYSVQGVPRSVINDKAYLEGAVPEALFVAKIQETLGMITSEEMQKLVEGFEAGAEQPEHES
jgi:predicted DsbA family dithiol-disulfide isomerase